LYPFNIFCDDGRGVFVKIDVKKRGSKRAIITVGTFEVTGFCTLKVWRLVTINFTLTF
jgi:hypothetical protein